MRHHCRRERDCTVGGTVVWWLHDVCMLVLRVCRYQKLLAECSPVRLLDLRDMQKQVREAWMGAAAQLHKAVTATQTDRLWCAAASLLRFGCQVTRALEE